MGKHQHLLGEARLRAARIPFRDAQQAFHISHAKWAGYRLTCPVTRQKPQPATPEMAYAIQRKHYLIRLGRRGAVPKRVPYGIR